MATYQVFIEAEEIPEQELTKKVSYLYSDGYLRVYNRGHTVSFERANKGDGFVIICDKGKAFLRKMVPPRGSGALVTWFLRFNKYNRATSIEEYEKLLYWNRNKRQWEGYREREHKSEGYVFTLCNSPVDDNYRNVAGFVSEAVTKKEVIELIPLMTHHPDWYIQILLWETFGVTQEEFQNARKKTFEPL